MSKKILVAMIILLIMTAGLIGVLLANTYYDAPDREYPNQISPPDRLDPEDRDRYISTKVAFCMINLVLSSILIMIYVKVYRETKAEFTIGLIIMMFSLFLYALLSNPLLPILFGYKVFGIGPFSMLPDLFSMVALSILLYLGLK
ncbi:MAG: hypothetical protein KAJ33_05075 [Thermoplasmata archaeon]|nr:hypothetical protein [Thermoplasmata archaeon]